MDAVFATLYVSLWIMSCHQVLSADHLIHCRWHLAQSKQPLQLHDVEIGHADAFNFPRLFESFHSLPTKPKGRLSINTNTMLLIHLIIQEVSPEAYLSLPQQVLMFYSTTHSQAEL